MPVTVAVFLAWIRFLTDHKEDMSIKEAVEVTLVDIPQFWGKTPRCKHREKHFLYSVCQTRYE